ncbi:hypothetical protein PV377_41035 [Streptomyces ipomoeae]|uniref:hypothetical protein n=1 Tax=Streptomyces ipomoeae TaxID=103232 RepID=UPI0029B28175|nr:hypothetical protein [Streptomyces ipomoeae]MDX2845231.1 hypothetical protein [Streptomyces ipomoeae]
MPETGTSWKRAFKGTPIEASEVRAWTRTRAPHPDAALIANELFAAILASGADLIEMTISTAGTRTRITATGPDPLPLRHSHGPGWRIVAGLAHITGITPDETGLWAQMPEEHTQ